MKAIEIPDGMSPSQFATAVRGAVMRYAMTFEDCRRLVPGVMSDETLFQWQRLESELFKVEHRMEEVA